MMRSRILGSVGMLFACWATSVSAQEVIWRAATPSSSTATARVSLGRPESLSQTAPPLPQAVTESPRVVRGQVPDPPLPNFPAGNPPPYSPVPPGADPYHGGAVNSDGDLGGFWSRTGNNIKRCWNDVAGSTTGAFQSGSDRKMFQSDDALGSFTSRFTSPVTNPFFFEDPRALTEVRPIFIWQHTPTSNAVWNGGNNYTLALSGSVAITERISFVVNRMGVEWINPNGNFPDVSPHSGFSELLLGPKITIIRSETSKTVAAIGLTFDIPSGSSNTLQDTGHLALVPYFSIAQNFGQTSYGSFNFMNTTGYSFRTDNTRSESFYSSFHLDFDIGDLKRFYPLVELNWRYYTRSGGNEPFNFEGSDLANFGSQHVTGLSDLTLAIGTRIKITQNIHWGIAAEFNILNNSGGRHLDEFRLTTDFIFRY